jgi:hypothetical protein
MKRLALLLILISLIVIGQKGWKYYTKYRHAQRLKIGVEGFRLPRLNISSLISEIHAKVNIGITNFSSSVFSIEQIKVDVYSPSVGLIAEQIEPLKQVHRVRANQKTNLPLSFLISPTNFKKLIKASGGVVNVGASYLTDGNYGIPIELRGFVVAEGVSIEINEKLTV